MVYLGGISKSGSEVAESMSSEERNTNGNIHCQVDVGEMEGVVMNASKNCPLR